LSAGSRLGPFGRPTGSAVQLEPEVVVRWPAACRMTSEVVLALPHGLAAWLRRDLELRLARYFSRAMAPSVRTSGALALHLLRRGTLRRDDALVRLAARDRRAVLPPRAPPTTARLTFKAQPGR
jgi:hypothetical protein